MAAPTLIIFISVVTISWGQSPERNNKLVGTWRLIDFANTDSLGNWVYPFGKNPRGFVTYTKTHIFNINMSSDVPLNVKEEDSKKYTITLDEFLWKYSFGYFGNYAVDFKKSIVTHQVKGAAGSIGFPEIGRAAAVLDENLKALQKQAGDVPQDQLRVCVELSGELQRLARGTTPEMSALYDADLSKLAR